MSTEDQEPPHVVAAHALGEIGAALFEKRAAATGSESDTEAAQGLAAIAEALQPAADAARQQGRRGGR